MPLMCNSAKQYISGAYLAAMALDSTSEMSMRCCGSRAGVVASDDSNEGETCDNNYDHK